MEGPRNALVLGGCVYRLEFPPGTKLISANGRSSKYAVSASSRFAKAKVTGQLRDMACVLAKKAAIPRLGKVRIRATYFPPDNRRRDSSNVLFFSVKASVDGCVDAGILADDNDKIVKSTELIPGDHIVRGGQMVIEVIPDE